MNFASKMRQAATYWASTGQDEYGRTTFAAPTALLVRWEDVAELIRDKHGDEYVSKSTVYCANDFALDGYLFLGTSVGIDPRAITGAHEIKQISRMPDLRNMQTLYTAFL